MAAMHAISTLTLYDYVILSSEKYEGRLTGTQVTTMPPSGRRIF